MPRIFDNIELSLLPALEDTLKVAHHADFCVGYFNLRGWRRLDCHIGQWTGGEGHCCRLLVGMQSAPEEEFRAAMSLVQTEDGIDNQTALRLKKKLAEEFRNQLTLGFQTNADEAGLHRLAAQIKAKKLVVKLFLRHHLHAKLYLMYRNDPINPIVGYTGSSNLTLAGLKQQGELNLDVLDHDAAKKLAKWFDDRWNDRWCIDISEELVKIIEESWARTEVIPPYHIYLKMAYHLSQEARAGLSEFRIPKVFGDKLFDYQAAAVKIAARHLHKRGGVLIGDVVGLGKTLMATALARIFEDDFGLETLIVCPKNLVKMWEDYRHAYGLRGHVLSVTRAIQELPHLRRYRLLLLDESHNLRNRDGKTYRVIRDYIEKNDSQCILLTATPYNKTYLDLSNQLRLFVPEDRDIGIRPENLLRKIGETEFARVHQASPRSLAAFEKSDFADDWRELMRLYMVRRTRSFIQENYASTECSQCQTVVRATETVCSACGASKEQSERRFLTFEDGSRSYFPTRKPKTVKFEVDAQYAQFYAEDVVEIINSLTLPRYGLGNYVQNKPHQPPTNAEAKTLQDLSRAGKRLMGFCRTNLFKRLESSGQSFLLSVERHILRNYIFLHAIHNGLPIPIGTQGAELLDSRFFDEDNENVTEENEESVASASETVEVTWAGEFGFANEVTAQQTFTETFASAPPLPPPAPTAPRKPTHTPADFAARAAEVYHQYATHYKSRFKWLSPALFMKSLAEDLETDALALQKVLAKCDTWEPIKDAKLAALTELLTKKHPQEKVLIFTQFADTVRYLERELKRRNVAAVEGVSGQSADPTGAAWRFSPESNRKRTEVSAEAELRVLLATDVLSEGQNLQDAAIVVSYDLPWAIIRLIQRAGRVDRIGQKAEAILCYSFLPAEGVNKIIRLRDRLRQRLSENAEVVGTDEQFFEDDKKNQAVHDLFTEKSGILDGDTDNEVDLASYAYQIWRNAITADPTLQKTIPELPGVVYSARAHTPTPAEPEGALVYIQTGDGNDALAWMNAHGSSVTESQYAILKAAECAPDTPAVQRMEKHHELVKQGVEHIAKEERNIGGQLGRPSGARFRTYERLQRHAQQVQGTLFDSPELHKVIEDIYRYPLTQVAVDRLNTHLRSEVSDEMLSQLAILLWNEDRLCIKSEEQQQREPRIVCSLGLV